MWDRCRFPIWGGFERGDGEDIWGSIQRSSFYSPRISQGTPGDVPGTATLLVFESLIRQDIGVATVSFGLGGIYGIPVLTCRFCRFFLLLLGGPWGWSVLYFLGFFMVLEVSNRGSRTQPRVLNRSVTQPRLSKTVASLEQGIWDWLSRPKVLGGSQTTTEGPRSRGSCRTKEGLKRRGGSWTRGRLERLHNSLCKPKPMGLYVCFAVWMLFLDVLCFFAVEPSYPTL